MLHTGAAHLFRRGVDAKAEGVLDRREQHQPKTAYPGHQGHHEHDVGRCWRTRRTVGREGAQLECVHNKDMEVFLFAVRVPVKGGK